MIIKSNLIPQPFWVFSAWPFIVGVFWPAPSTTKPLAQQAWELERDGKLTGKLFNLKYSEFSRQ